MKKLLAAFLIVLILCATVLPVLAGAADANGSSDTLIPVSGIFQENIDTKTIISVDITWDNMEFTYASAVTKTWDPATHTYTQASEGGWSGEARSITLTNHSNAPVNAVFSFETDADVSGVFTNSQLNLASAENTTISDAPVKTTVFSITGGKITQSRDLGIIRIALSSNSSANTDDDQPTGGNDAPAETESAVCYYRTSNEVPEEMISMTKEAEGIYSVTITNTDEADELLVRFVVDGIGYAIFGTGLKKVMSSVDVVPVTSGKP